MVVQYYHSNFGAWKDAPPMDNDAIKGNDIMNGLRLLDPSTLLFIQDETCTLKGTCSSRSDYNSLSLMTSWKGDEANETWAIARDASTVEKALRFFNKYAFRQYTGYKGGLFGIWGHDDVYIGGYGDIGPHVVTMKHDGDKVFIVSEI